MYSTRQILLQLMLFCDVTPQKLRKEQLLKLILPNSLSEQSKSNNRTITVTRVLKQVSEVPKISFKNKIYIHICSTPLHQDPEAKTDPRQQLPPTGRNLKLDLEFTGPYSAQPACVPMLSAGGSPQRRITSQPSGTVTVYRIGSSAQRVKQF